MSAEENKALARRHYYEDFPDIDAAFPDREWIFENQIAEGDMVTTQ